MKRLLFALLAGAFLVLLLMLVWPAPATKKSKFSVGPSLPSGKVTPQLVSTWDTAVLLAPDGSLWAWGGAQFGLGGIMPKPTLTAIPQRVGTNTDWRAISSSWTFVIALKDDGSLWGWGNNSDGALAQQTSGFVTSPIRIGTDTNWTQISAGASHAMGLKSDGSLWTWGQGRYGQIGDGTITNHFVLSHVTPGDDWQSIAAGVFNSYALKSNGTVWGWGLDPLTGGRSNTLSSRQIDSSTNWISISASDYSLLGIKSDGTLWIYGQNAGQSAPKYLTTPTSTFVQIGSGHDWREAYAGQGFFFARKQDGSWWVSGGNYYGQLAQGNTISVPAPSPLGFNFDPWAFAIGYGNCVLLTKDGTLWTWGERAGDAPSMRWQPLKLKWNSLVSRLPQSVPRFPTQPQNKIDTTPYRLWQLPASNSSSK